MSETNGRTSVDDIETTSIDKEAPQREAPAFELTGSKLLLVMVGLSLAIFLTSVDSSIIATAIPRITSQFSSTDDIGWYGSVYSFATCAFQPISGKLFANFSMKVRRLGKHTYLDRADQGRRCSSPSWLFSNSDHCCAELRSIAKC
jgi:Na+-driven multidrug efflux pump